MNYKAETDNHITVCICTYKRPQLLSRLLNKLQDQVTDNLFSYSAVIVDNDNSQSAKTVVVDWQNKSAIKIDYFNESRQNIALARNKAVANATGNFITFIDDDEFPENTWLINLFKIQQEYKVAGVLGPVKPYFEVMPPQWVVKSRICERSSFPTGTILKRPTDTRTGNVLFDKATFADLKEPFNPAFGLSGGEDVDFFTRMMKNGLTFIWCDEARVYESVPLHRLRKKHFLKRALLRGGVVSDKSSLLSTDTAKSLVAIAAYTVALPFLAIAGQHLFMKYLIKDCDHIGKILGLMGYKIVDER